MRKTQKRTLNPMRWQVEFNDRFKEPGDGMFTRRMAYFVNWMTIRAWQASGGILRENDPFWDAVTAEPSGILDNTDRELTVGWDTQPVLYTRVGVAWLVDQDGFRRVRYAIQVVAVPPAARWEATRAYVWSPRWTIPQIVFGGVDLRRAIRAVTGQTVTPEELADPAECRRLAVDLPTGDDPYQHVALRHRLEDFADVIEANPPQAVNTGGATRIPPDEDGIGYVCRQPGYGFGRLQ